MKFFAPTDYMEADTILYGSALTFDCFVLARDYIHLLPSTNTQSPISVGSIFHSISVDVS